MIVNCTNYIMSFDLEQYIKYGKNGNILSKL